MTGLGDEPEANADLEDKLDAALNACIRDDSTECDCPRCVGAEDAFWRAQGEPS